LSCLGVHFALDEADQQKVLGAAGDQALLDVIQEDIERRLNDDEFSFQTDKAWDAIHRCLTNGKLEYGPGGPPLSYCILGGRRLYFGDDYIVCYVDPEQVARCAEALRSISREELRKRYFALDTRKCGYPLTNADFDYTWSNFEGLPAFFETAAKAGRPVIFTADQ
jgi:hypothetical protein